MLKSNLLKYCKIGIFTGHLNIAIIAQEIHALKLNHAICKWRHLTCLEYEFDNKTV